MMVTLGPRLLSFLMARPTAATHAPDPADSAGLPTPATHLNPYPACRTKPNIPRLAIRKLSPGGAADTGNGKRGDSQAPCAAATFKVGTGRLSEVP
jgi:hypothetical protein